MTKLSEKLQDYQLALGLTIAGIFSVLVVYAPLYLGVFFFTKSFNMFLTLLAWFVLYSIIVLPIVAVIALKILEKDSQKGINIEKINKHSIKSLNVFRSSDSIKRTA